MSDQKHYASWSLSCDVECPKCKHWFDLMDMPDFMDGLQPCEHRTPRSEGIEVECPKCDHEFKVDLEY